MFSIFETINSKANEVTESVKSSLNGLDSDSVLDLFTETNEKVSRMFSQDEDTESGSQSHAASRNGNHVQFDRDKQVNRMCLLSERPTVCPLRKEATLTQPDSTEDDLPSYDENLPGYAKSTAYLEEREVCRRVTVTARKLTEADLDEEDPLYCDRETREKQGSPNDHEEEEEEEGVGQEIVRCFREHFERLRILILESFLDLDMT